MEMFSNTISVIIFPQQSAIKYNISFEMWWNDNVIETLSDKMM